MKAHVIAAFLETLAPFSLAYPHEELGFVVGYGEKEVLVMGVMERPTLRVLTEAKEKRCDMLVIHEPLYQTKKSSVIDPSFLEYPPNQKREKTVNEGGFCVYRFHSQWDDADEGNNTILVRLLELSNVEKIPYGRIGSLPPLALQELIHKVKKVLHCTHVLVVGDTRKSVSRIAVVAGSGNALTEMMEYAKQKGAEVFISGDIQDSRARFAEELGLMVIDAGDYFTENPGARHLASLVQKQFPQLKVVHLDPGPPWKVI